MAVEKMPEEVRKMNKYYSRRFSILGDSISTLEGFNPEGYNLFYTGETCERTGVREVPDTWWGQVIDYFGGELLVNNSWSGSCVTCLPGQRTFFPSGCSDERTAGLHKGSVMPNVIIIALGVNDWGHGTTVAPSNDLSEVNKPWPYMFAAAYTEMLRKIRRNYPLAEIWCCTLTFTCIASRPSFSFPFSFGGVHMEEYNRTIRNAAANEGCKVIDLYAYQLPYESIDGTHPTKDGMNRIAEMVIRSMS